MFQGPICQSTRWSCRSALSRWAKELPSWNSDAIDRCEKWTIPACSRPAVRKLSEGGMAVGGVGGGGAAVPLACALSQRAAADHPLVIDSDIPCFIEALPPPEEEQPRFGSTRGGRSSVRGSTRGGAGSLEASQVTVLALV